MLVFPNVLIRFSNNAKGTIRSSQIATGEENNLTVAIYGDKGGFRWEQENPNYLYYLTSDKPLQVLKPGNPYLGILIENQTTTKTLVNGSYSFYK